MQTLLASQWRCLLQLFWRHCLGTFYKRQVGLRLVHISNLGLPQESDLGINSIAYLIQGSLQAHVMLAAMSVKVAVLADQCLRSLLACALSGDKL